MADLKLLTERVVEKEKAAMRKEIEEAKIQAEDELQAVEAEEVQKRGRLKEEIKNKADQRYTIKKNTLEIKRRNEVLAAKQEILNAVFEEANRKLDTLNEADFKTFTLGALNQFDEGSAVTMKLGTKSAAAFDRSWVNALSDKKLTVRMSEETVANQSGFIIEKDGIDYNFLFSNLVEDARMDILPEISKELF
ncbi:V-type ATPase subunit E [Alkalibacterium psychrotolerans]